MSQRYTEVINSKSRDDWLRLIHQWIHNERDRNMLVLYLLDALTIEQVADKVGLSVVQTQVRLSRARKQLFLHI